MALKKLGSRSCGDRTLAIHAGERPDKITGASAPNIVMSSTYVSDEPMGFSAYDLTDESPFIYSRWSNPTVAQLEEKLALLENAEAAACFSSGMAAANAIFMSVLEKGDHVVVSDITYPGVAELVRHQLPLLGIEVTTFNESEPQSLLHVLQNNTKLVYIETPANPILRLADIAKIADITHSAGAKLAVDSTFATPMATRPLELGADYVMHSLTKYFCGHGDAIGGGVAADKKLIQELVSLSRIHHGGVLSPFNAWLISRGATTLPVRMQIHQQVASEVAMFLEQHPSVKKVLYPGLQSHPQHELAKQQMRNFGGMIAFQPKTDGNRLAKKMAKRLGIIHYAVSLGHHRSLLCWMPTEDLNHSSFMLAGEQLASYRESAGDGIFRLSVGLENAEDICADLDTVL